MSGYESCRAIEEKKEKLKKDKKTISVVKGIATQGLNRLWEKEDDDDDNEVYNFIKNSYNKVKDTISINYCNNLIGSIQDNVFIQNPSCFERIQQICYNKKTNKYDEICLEKLYNLVDKYNDEPIVQTNKNIQLAECNINSVLGILTQQEQTLESLAIIKLIQEEQAKNKKSTSDSCSEISSDITKEQYLRSFLQCSNNNIIEQKNVITSECNPNVSAQINVNRGINRCIVESNLANNLNSQVTQRTILPFVNDNLEDIQKNNEDTKEYNKATTTPNNNNNNSNIINIIIIFLGTFVGFILLMVFLFFIFRNR